MTTNLIEAMTKALEIVLVQMEKAETWTDYRDEARTLLAAIEAAGYRVVPVHPTEAMMDAFNTPASFMASVSFAERWKLALAAAPKVTE